MCKQNVSWHHKQSVSSVPQSILHGQCQYSSVCFNHLINSPFQFYLSLENSLCQDYITEKFWKILPYNMIPIVLNGVNMSNTAPPHSYIDIKDFKTFGGQHQFCWIGKLDHSTFRFCRSYCQGLSESINVCVLLLVETILLSKSLWPQHHLPQWNVQKGLLSTLCNTSLQVSLQINLWYQEILGWW